MIPLTLTLKGIYSYKEEQTIDFRELTSSHLFGIFGSVGSGKSTILEAITYALFGKIKRLGTDFLNYNMMNLSSNEMTIDFTFIANNGKTYNTLCKSKRNSKKNEDVKTNKTAYEIIGSNNNDKIPIDFSSIEKIIGLSYDNFRRSIIIPQGSFQEFLELTGKERSEMLENIFDLQKYNLSGKTLSLRDKTQKELVYKSGEIKQYEYIESKNADEVKQNIENLLIEIEKIESELKINRNNYNEIKKLKQEQDNLEKIKSELFKLSNEKLNIDTLIKQKREYEFFIKNIKPLKDKISEIQKKVDNDKVQLLYENRNLENNITSLKNLDIEINSFKEDYDKRDNLKIRSEEILIIIDIKRIEEELKKLFSENEQNNKSIKNSILKIHDNKEKLNANEENLKKIKHFNLDISMLKNIENWHNLNEKIIEEGKEKRIKIENTKKEIENLEKQIVLNINTAKIEYIHLNLNEIDKLLKDKIAELEKEIASKDLIIRDLEIENRLSEYSKNLQDGKPCPLCGSLEHKHKLNNVDVSAKLNKEKNEKNNSINLVKDIRELYNKIIVDFKQKETKETMLLQNENEINKQLEEFKKHGTNFIYNEKYRDSKQLEKDIKLYNQNYKEREKLEIEIDKLRKEIEKEQDIELKLKEKISEFETKTNKINATINEKLSQIKNINIDDYKLFDEKTLELKALKLINSKKEIEIKFDKLTNDINNLKIDNAKSSTRIEELNKHIKFNEVDLEQTNLCLNKVFSQNIEINKDNIKIYESKELNFDEIEKQISKFEKNIIELEFKKKQLEESVKEFIYNEKDYKQIESKLVELEQNLIIKREEKGKYQNELENYNKDFENYKTLKSEIEKLDNRLKNLNTINRLFEGKKFVNYVSTLHLESLCNEANIRFTKLTNGQLLLKLNKDNGFDVEDMLNDGKYRNIKTLSGGQKFIASLCLALSLSDIINRKSNIEQNFFFMDEGFGSLDKQSLKAVFSTLQTLKKENRIVGLISHVEDMQEEIDKYLIIEKDKSMGSMIKYSWK